MKTSKTPRFLSLRPPKSSKTLYFWHVGKPYFPLNPPKNQKTRWFFPLQGGPKKLVLAMEREARLNERTWSQALFKRLHVPDFATSCGLRPRLRRSLDHVQRVTTRTKNARKSIQ